MKAPQLRMHSCCVDWSHEDFNYDKGWTDRQDTVWTIRDQSINLFWQDLSQNEWQGDDFFSFVEWRLTNY